MTAGANSSLLLVLSLMVDKETPKSVYAGSAFSLAALEAFGDFGDGRHHNVHFGVGFAFAQDGSVTPNLYAAGELVDGRLARRCERRLALTSDRVAAEAIVVAIKARK